MLTVNARANPEFLDEIYTLQQRMEPQHFLQKATTKCRKGESWKKWIYLIDGYLILVSIVPDNFVLVDGPALRGQHGAVLLHQQRQEEDYEQGTHRVEPGF
jgi:hypothetical protein